MQPSSVFCLPLLAVFEEVFELLLIEPVELLGVLVSWLVLEPIWPVLEELELLLGVCVLLLPLG